MAEERDIQQALDILKERRRTIGKRNSRHHGNEDEDNLNRTKALQGVCGGCQNLIVQFERSTGRDIIVLRCRAGRSPLNLHRDTPFGDKVVCDKEIPKRQDQALDVNALGTH